MDFKVETDAEGAISLPAQALPWTLVPLASAVNKSTTITTTTTTLNAAETELLLDPSQKVLHDPTNNVLFLLPVGDPEPVDTVAVNVVPDGFRLSPDALGLHPNALGFPAPKKISTPVKKAGATAPSLSGPRSSGSRRGDPLSDESRELRFVNEIKDDHVQCLFCQQRLPKVYVEIQRHLDEVHRATPMTSPTDQAPPG